MRRGRLSSQKDTMDVSSCFARLKPVPLALGVVLLASTAAVAGPIAAPPAHIAIEDPPILPLNQVKRGQKGIGYTVFASARGPEEFGFEILGVMRSYLGPGEDLIIAKLVGEQIERTGVISGMSGSPAYIDGKLIGAVGYRFGSFTKDAIAGITPIERMLAVADANPDAPSPAKGAPSSQATLMTPWGKAEPISTPVVQSGLSPHVITAFAPHLKERGLWPVLPAAAGGGGASSTSSAAPRLFASGPIAGLMVDGDIKMAGVGTVTWVKGDRFLAFGHPFMGIGTTQMPVSDAEIVTTVASAAGSWKMGQATVPVGRLTDDRLHAIAGDMGVFPTTVPVEVDLYMGGPRGKRDARKLLKYTVMQHPTDTPLYIAIALANAMEGRVSLELGGTLEVTGQATLSTGDVVPLHARGAQKGSAVDIQAAIAVLNSLSRLTQHGLQDVHVEAVKLKITRVDDVIDEVVTGVRALDPLVPGRDVRVAVHFARLDRPAVVDEVTVRLPKGLSDGRYALVAAAPRRAMQLEKEAGLIPVVTDFKQLLQVHATKPRSGSVTLYLVQERKGLRLGGQALHDLPASLRGALDEGGGTAGRLLETHANTIGRLQRDGVTRGVARGRVVVSTPPRR